MTVYRRKNLDGTTDDYEALPIMENPEFVKSLPEARESTNEVHMYCGHDEQGRLWIGPHARMPTRDEFIQGLMTVPTCYPTKNEQGHSVMGEKRWLTIEEATDKVDRLYPDLKPEA